MNVRQLPKRLLEFVLGHLASLFAARLIERARLTPYTHLFHSDGSFYMERFWLFQTRWLSCRLHHICSHDWDPHLHDHPWDFVSVVLKGAYVERRPHSPIKPVFVTHDFEGRREMVEPYTTVARKRGSICYRRATDRHRISYVAPGTWTLFFLRPRIQWWGFYTPAGKIHYRNYE